MATSGGFDDAREFWDQRFAAPEYIFGTEPNAFLSAQAERFKSGDRVLDVACGEGRNSVWLAKLGCQVTGIDISPLALAKARRLADTHGVKVDYREADIRDWQWQPARFDAVACVFIQFAEPAQRTRLFEGIETTLTPGGLLVLQGYTPKQLEYKTGGAAAGGSHVHGGAAAAGVPQSGHPASARARRDAGRRDQACRPLGAH